MKKLITAITLVFCTTLTAHATTYQLRGEGRAYTVTPLPKCSPDSYNPSDWVNNPGGALVDPAAVRAINQAKSSAVQACFNAGLQNCPSVGDQGFQLIMNMEFPDGGFNPMERICHAVVTFNLVN